MDIAAISMSLSSAKVQMAAGISVAKKSMDQQQIQADGLMKMIESSAPQVSIPQEGHILDIKV